MTVQRRGSYSPLQDEFGRSVDLFINKTSDIYLNWTNLPNTFLGLQVGTFVAKLIQSVSSKMEVLRHTVTLNVDASVLVGKVLIALGKSLNVTDLNLDLLLQCEVALYTKES